MRMLAAVLFLMSAIMSLGCGGDSPSKPAPVTTPPSANGHSAPPTVVEQKSDGVTLDIKSWDETLALVAEHKGKVVVLDLWSTSCEPCMIEFPYLVELHKQHGGDKLVCVSVSCDFVGIKGKPPESYKERVLEFLTQQDAKFPNVLLNVEPDVLFEKLDLASNPAVFVFGRDGELAKRFDNDNAKKGEDFTYEKDVVPFVEKLLSE